MITIFNFILSLVLLTQVLWTNTKILNWIETKGVSTEEVYTQKIATLKQIKQDWNPNYPVEVSVQFNPCATHVEWDFLNDQVDGDLICGSPYNRFEPEFCFTLSKDCDTEAFVTTLTSNLTQLGWRVNHVNR